MHTTIEAILLEPLRLFNDPSERVWWGALCAALAIAILWEFTRVGRWRGALARALPKHILIHPSSRVDMQFIFVRAFVRVVLIAALPFGAQALAVKVVLWCYQGVGAPPVVLTGATLVAVYSTVLFLVSDASRYVIHRLLHRIPVLWRFHQVHHSAEVLTPLTLYRNHPCEQLLQAGRGIIVLGAVGGLFAWLSFGKASVAQLYGVPAAMFVFNVLGANLRHSHNWLPYPRWAEHLFISPAQHQMHHGRADIENRVNYGNVLSIWDRLGGSHRYSSEGQPTDFGLEASDRHHRPRSVWSAIIDPLWRRQSMGE
ncbi:MAG: sterol desaturase family protein [Myxococcota bacterium]|nr:sterol desaturase family protein [Myxococcota bacterium]